MDNKYFKYNKDDILEIITEYLAEENGFETFIASSNLIIENGVVSFVAAIGELGNEEVDSINLNELFKEMNFNGTHSGVGLTDEQMGKALDKMIETGDF